MTEKDRNSGEIDGMRPSGPKGHADSVGFVYGLKPVPFTERRFSAARKAPIDSLVQNPAPFKLSRRPAIRQRVGEEGYILLAVLFMVVMVLILLSIAAPKVAADIERDREVELIHRGNQYVRAIKLYYKKFGAYPPSLEALEKSNEIRFLRKRYRDPMTGKDEWHLIHFGENKTPSYGFFGQPLSGTGGSALAGVGPGGAGQALGGAQAPGAFGSSGSSSSFGGGSFGSNSSGSNSAGSAGTDPNAGNPTGTTNGAGTGVAGATGTDPNAAAGSSSSSAPGGSTNGLSVGGLGIIGVESTSPKESVLEWKKKKHFNEWEFWYDPNADRVMMSGNTGTIGQPAGAGGSGSSFGNAGGSPGQSGFGSPPPGQGGQAPGAPMPNQPQGTQPQQ